MRPSTEQRGDSMARVKEEEIDEVQEFEITEQQQRLLLQQQTEQVTQEQRLQQEEDEEENVASRTKRARRTSSDGHFQVQSPSIMDRAKEVQANLNPEFPSFTKLMVHSHVTKRLVGLPSQFCKQHLPKHDETVVLVGENGEGHRVKFLAHRYAFSAGWMGFSLAHELQEGDIVVFQLVRPCKFKVYIVRRNSLYFDEAAGLLDLEGNASERNIEVDGGSLKKHGTRKKAKGNINPELVRDNAPTDTAASFLVANGQCENCGEDSHPESMDCSRNSRPFVNFQSFTIIVNGLATDSQLNENVRTKYYELCCSRKSYLHNRLLRTINPRLAAEMISEIVNIADAIRACGLFTSQADFAVWENTLEGFSFLGMDVGFLRARLNQLVNLAVESTKSPEFMEYNEARLQLTRLEEDITKLEKTLCGRKHAKNVLNSDIDTLKTNVQRYELIFEEAAHAPWWG